MVNLTNYPHPTYESNKPVAIVLAILIGISLIGWLIQCIQSRFTPRRLSILLLVAHTTMFIELILRAVLSFDTRKSRTAFTVTTVLLAINQRVIIIATYSFLIEIGHLKPRTCRLMIIAVVLSVITSAVLMTTAGALSYSVDTIDASFQLRQASAAIVLLLTVLFYPVWFATKTAQYMSKQAIALVSISSIMCLVVAVYLMVTSFPYYYISATEDERWFYISQFTPIAIALLTWTILHPKRSIVLSEQYQVAAQKIDIECEA